MALSKVAPLASMVVKNETKKIKNHVAKNLSNVHRWHCLWMHFCHFIWHLGILSHKINNLAMSISFSKRCVSSPSINKRPRYGRFCDMTQKKLSTMLIINGIELCQSWNYFVVHSLNFSCGYNQIVQGDWDQNQAAREVRYPLFLNLVADFNFKFFKLLT